MDNIPNNLLKEWKIPLLLRATVTEYLVQTIHLTGKVGKTQLYKAFPKAPELKDVTHDCPNKVVPSSGPAKIQLFVKFWKPLSKDQV